MKNDLSNFGTLPDEALVSIAAIAALAGIGLSTAQRHAFSDKEFPTPYRLSTRCTRYRVGAVRAWLAKKSA